MAADKPASINITELVGLTENEKRIFSALTVFSDGPVTGSIVTKCRLLHAGAPKADLDRIRITSFDFYLHGCPHKLRDLLCAQLGSRGLTILSPPAPYFITTQFTDLKININIIAKGSVSPAAVRGEQNASIDFRKEGAFLCYANSDEVNLPKDDLFLPLDASTAASFLYELQPIKKELPHGLRFMNIMLSKLKTLSLQDDQLRDFITVTVETVGDRKYSETQTGKDVIIEILLDRLDKTYSTTAMTLAPIIDSLI
jgi:hypothetical protein